MIRPLQECVAEVEDVLSLASDSFDVWWDLVNADAPADYELVLKRYEQFFQGTIRAHFFTAVVCLHSIYDKTKGTQTIPRLLDRLACESLDTVLVVPLKKSIEDNRGTLVKIATLRHNVFAHRSIKGAPELWFSEVKLTPDEFRAFILESRRILNHVAIEAGMQPVFGEAASPHMHTQEVMRALSQRLAEESN